MPFRVRKLLILPLLPMLAGLAYNAPLRALGPAREATAGAVRSTIQALATRPAAASATLSPISTDPAPTATPDFSTPGPEYIYQTRSGDTLLALGARFGVDPAEIVADQALSPGGYLPIALELRVPNVLGDVSPGVAVLPDSEVVYSPAAADFDVQAFVLQAGGFLAGYEEMVPDDTVMSGAAIVQRVADELSVNPRLLLGLLEYRSGWVFGSPPGAEDNAYPLGLRIPGRTGLYQELLVAGTQLNRGYYGWRQGTQVETDFDDGSPLRFHPELNAGSVAVMHLFAVLRPRERWTESLYGPASFPAQYVELFGDPWRRSEALGPLLPVDLTQPALELPFGPGERWSLTGGPHPAWNAGTPRGALDFSPITGGDPCAVSARWVTASAAGTVGRAADNAVALDLDGDGREPTGWVLVYFHLADDGLIQEGAQVVTGSQLGHPSCEGGRSTGKHVHLARKYNGEWLEADGPVPLVLSGWQAVADERNYYGSLVRGSEAVTSDSSGRSGSTITR
jgi:LasA protease